MAHNNEVYLKIDRQNYILKSDHPSAGDQGLSLRYFITPSLIESLIFFVFFYYRGQKFIHLSGRISISSVIFLLGVISSFILSSVFLFIKKEKDVKI